MCKAQIKAKIGITVLKEMLEIAKIRQNKTRTTDFFLIKDLFNLSKTHAGKLR